MDPVAIALIAIVSIVVAVPVIIKMARHHTCTKFGKVEGRWQYCTDCGRAIEPIPAPCLHPKWAIHKEESILVGKSTKGKITILKCEECGDMKKFAFSVDDVL